MKHKWFKDKHDVYRCSKCNVIWNKSNRDEECEVLMDDYKLYKVVMVDPDNLEKHIFEYLAEDSNDARGYAQHDHPDYDVKSVTCIEV